MLWSSSLAHNSKWLTIMLWNIWPELKVSILHTECYKVSSLVVLLSVIHDKTIRLSRTEADVYGGVGTGSLNLGQLHVRVTTERRHRDTQGWKQYNNMLVRKGSSWKCLSHLQQSSARLHKEIGEKIKLGIDRLIWFIKIVHYYVSNVHTLEVVGHSGRTQIQVSEKFRC